MSLYALVSAGGSPGVTTSALALTLGWPSQVIMAECDPSGGDVLAGLFAGHLPATKGIVSLALAAGQSPDAVTAALWHQLVELDDERSRLLLPGVSDPRQGAGLAPAWPVLATALAGLPADVIADCGRLDATSPAYVLQLAAVAVLVLRPSLRQVSRARSRVEMLTQIMGGPDKLALLLVGEGTHAPREISKALGITVAGTLPHDRKTAAVLSDGAGSRRGLPARPLIRAAVGAGRALRTAAGAAEPPRPGGRPGTREPGAGQPSTSQHGAHQHGASQPGASQHSAGQPGAHQPGAHQPGAHQPGAHQPGANQPGTSQRGGGRRGPGQHEAGHRGTSQHEAIQLDTGQLGTGQFGVGQLGTGQLGTGQFGAGQFGAGPSGTGSFGTGQLGAGPSGTGSFGTGQLGAGPSGTGPSGTGQFGAGRAAPDPSAT